MPQRLTVLFRQRTAHRVLLGAAIGCCAVFASAISLAEPLPSPIDRSVIQQFATSGQPSGQSKPGAVVAAPPPAVEVAPKIPVSSPVQPPQSQSNVAAAAQTTPDEAVPEVPAAPAVEKPMASTPAVPAARLAVKTETVAPPTVSTGYAGQPAAMDSALIRQLTGAGSRDSAAASTGTKAMPRAQMDLIQQVFAPEMTR